ncbi:hypothetical protein C8N40_11382 [Pontibacter mucosus]|uniref:Outer membrane protein with beta-barrel domain n=1 Tax=Pontibacter mucosus TaxID=1649266 RepID=A0A2T5Y9T6_9BACT|nr:hypothetical protein [Pontibacter mucosus]PTX13160.1 hypothetical protein C8N40_11382 [Pontibacter mucosus]
MRKTLLLSLLLLVVLPCRAQEGYTHLNLAGGWMYEDALTANLALEFNQRHHNSYEIFGDAYKSNVDANKNWLVGAYKPMLIRSRNTLLKLRLGTGIGSNTAHFIGALQAGLELVYVLPGNLVLMLQQKNEGVLRVNHNFRAGLLAGIKIPL